jgi:hypothetical protein
MTRRKPLTGKEAPIPLFPLSGGAALPAGTKRVFGLILCEPMPDEPAMGHAGRMARLNGHSRIDTLGKGSRWDSENNDDRLPDRLLRLLVASGRGRNPDVYSAQHSMYPFARKVTTLDRNQFLAKQQREYLDSGLLRKRRLRYCHDCAAEDFEAHGFSWYRRAHNFPGFDWCLEHDDPLLEVGGDNPYLSNPHEWYGRGKAVRIKAAFPRYSAAPEFIHRYATAFRELGDCPGPVDNATVGILLTRKAAGFPGRGAHKRNRNPDFVELVAQSAPAGWLNESFGGTRERIKDFAAVDRVNGARNEVFALIVAALYDDASEGIRELAETVIYGEGAPPSQAARTSLRRAAFHPTWASYERNARWLGKLLGKPTNVHRLQWILLPVLSELEQKATWQALVEFGEGASLEKACANHMVEVEEIERMLRNDLNEFIEFVTRLRDLDKSASPRK